MRAQEPVFDVILTYAPSEVVWAVDIERKLADAGLNAYRIVSAEPGSSLDDTWDAHAESHALIVLIAPGAMPPLLMFEAGAAMMGQKPIYVLYKGPRPSKLPRYVEQFGVFPAADVDRVVELVSEASRPLSEREQQILIESYTSLNTPIKKLLGQYEKAEQMARRVNRAAGSSLSTDRLLRELLRMRKQGHWPKLERQRASFQVN